MKSHRLPVILVIVTVILNWHVSFLIAQSGITAYYSTSATDPRIGESFTVRLIIESPTPVSLRTTDPLGDIDGLEVITEINPDPNDPATRVEIEYLIRLWKTGTFLSPEQFITVQDTSGAEYQIPVQSFSVIVPSEITDLSTASLRPSLPTIFIPIPWQNSYTAAIFAALLLFGIVALSMYRMIMRGEKSPGNLSPASMAGSLLANLESQNLSPAELYPIVVLILRNFIQQKWAIPAIEMTSTELIQYLGQRQVLTPSMRQQLQQFLEQADLVKFAQLQPHPDQNQRVITFAVRWIKQAESIEDRDE